MTCLLLILICVLAGLLLADLVWGLLVWLVCLVLPDDDAGIPLAMPPRWPNREVADDDPR